MMTVQGVEDSTHYLLPTTDYRQFVAHYPIPNTLVTDGYPRVGDLDGECFS
ncbi:hypothetical protein H6F78_05725 [Coleofasciculus sp. FACHB-64]|uniref:hypothetical protein n=1 Tax=Cyanophyceae TaxID=3028117 RepID=UPI001683DE17|nr:MULTISPECIES: hypothetical protein [unclassified Coleofasciculus]MBD1840383.1 hypothetical protein [Coleofasciculus sp. FACHB-501]MBD1881599.1 hypothetical protein [Coleofasciculus sp. FACHB-T130]MBD1888576.1 hypothetical protein [Coleofasciculus sp. FACHB-SPT9]MBD1895452.1 hypothetical protein [Coleofasciculus sp. FACHB-129]MBD1944768.1 hypothetical protein [Coleofasciculus sp. FACHB-712]